MTKMAAKAKAGSRETGEEGERASSTHTDVLKPVRVVVARFTNSPRSQFPISSCRSHVDNINAPYGIVPVATVTNRSRPE